MGWSEKSGKTLKKNEYNHDSLVANWQRHELRKGLASRINFHRSRTKAVAPKIGGANVQVTLLGAVGHSEQTGFWKLYVEVNC